MQLDDPVGPMAGPIARHRVAVAVDDRERGGGLAGIAEVAERDAPALRQPAGPVVTGREPSVEVVGEDDRLGIGDEGAGRGRLAGDRDLAHLAAGLRRAHPVDEGQVGEVLEEAGLAGRGEGGTAGQQEFAAR